MCFAYTGSYSRLALIPVVVILIFVFASFLLDVLNGCCAFMNTKHIAEHSTPNALSGALCNRREKTKKGIFEKKRKKSTSYEYNNLNIFMPDVFLSVFTFYFAFWISFCWLFLVFGFVLSVSKEEVKYTNMHRKCVHVSVLHSQTCSKTASRIKRLTSTILYIFFSLVFFVVVIVDALPLQILGRFAPCVYE